jgi:hypothetical protein
LAWHKSDERAGGKSTTWRDLFLAGGEGSDTMRRKRFFFEKKKPKTFVFEGLRGSGLPYPRFQRRNSGGTQAMLASFVRYP